MVTLDGTPVTSAHQVPTFDVKNIHASPQKKATHKLMMFLVVLISLIWKLLGQLQLIFLFRIASQQYRNSDSNYEHIMQIIIHA